MTKLKTAFYGSLPMDEVFSIERPLSEITESVRKGVNVFVVGPSGSGRRAVFAELAQHFAHALAIELLPLREVDAPSVALLEACAALQIDLDARSFDSADEIYDLAQTVARALEARDDRPLILRVPRDWARIARKDEVDDPVLEQADSLLRGFTATRSGVILVGDEHFDRKRALWGSVRTVRLQPRRLSFAQLKSQDRWESLQTSIDALEAHEVMASPVVLRLTVGAVASGESSEAAIEWAKQQDIDRLTRAIVDRLQTMPGGREALGMLAALRCAVERDRFEAALPSHTMVRGIVTRCLGYGDRWFRVADEVLTILREHCETSEQEQYSLAVLHRSLDGVNSPALLRSQRAARHWAEKVHHLAAAGEKGSSEWSDQTLPSPAFYWDRARLLSSQKLFPQAAAIYRQCLERFPNDDYAWHYWAFNLEKSGGPPEEIERGYRRAAELASHRVWWIGRLVSFLIKQGRFDDARRQWRTCLPHVLHEGPICRDPIVAHELHRWVAKDWFEAGSVDDAHAVLRTVDRSIVENDAELQQLHSRVCRRVERAKLRRELEGVWRDSPVVRTALECLKRFFKKHEDLPFPAVERIDEALRMTWENDDVLVQLELEEGFECEWYARDHRSKHSEAAVGEVTFESLDHWLRRISGG